MKKKFVLPTSVFLFFLALIVIAYFIFTGLRDGGGTKNFSREEGVITEIVDDGGWVGIDANIAVDKNNIPHISYYDQGNRDLKYATKLAGSWQAQTLDSEGDVGEESGIVIDSQGNPHISYVDATNGGVKYAVKKGDSWSIQVVDQPDGYQVRANSIGLDSRDNPHIIYALPSKTGGSNPVKYAYWNGVSWQIEQVVPMGTDASFALDSNDIPHVCFKKDLNNDNVPRIAYATKEGVSWRHEIVDTQTKAGGDCAIAIDSKNHSHLIYNDHGNNAKMYAFWDGVSWHTQTVAEDVGATEGIDVAIDKNDRPCIAYNIFGRADDNEYLVYACWDGNSWLKKKVDKPGMPAIVIDQDNISHLAYGHSIEDKEKRFSGIKIGDQKRAGNEIEILKYARVKLIPLSDESEE